VTMADRINYLLRPNKNIERKMLVELVNRLGSVHQLDEYKYIGFGSYFFNDFRLLHTRCGIRRMTSFENRAQRYQRALFNRPYRSIEVLQGDATDLLRVERWNRRSIVWMDYEGKLTASVLDDIQTIVSSAKAGSLVLFSVNAHPPTTAESNRKMRKHLSRIAYPELIGSTPQSKDMMGWGTAQIGREAIDSAILLAVRDRNSLNSGGWPVSYRQLVNFNYRDSVRMLTVGGLVSYDRDTDLYESAAFEKLLFFRDGPDAYVIDAPTLTTKEVESLRRQLPRGRKKVVLAGLGEDEVAKFEQLYRHYPTFAESEIF